VTGWLAFSAYFLAMLLTARAAYRRIRPWTEPLACRTPTDRYHEHDGSCYERAGVDGAEAKVFSVLMGAVWPLTLAMLAVIKVVTFGQQPFRAEVEARNERLERELGLGGDR
jgi:hypothetical protein